MMDTRKPDYALWDGLNVFNLWDAAYLWCGVAPPPANNSPFRRNALACEAYEKLIRFAEPVDTEGYSDIEKRFRRNDFLAIYPRNITRAALLAAADVYQVRPAFLFPDERAATEKPQNKKSDRKKTRTDNLKRAIQAASVVLSDELSRKPTATEVFQYFQDERDDTGVIDDSTDDKVIWTDSRGKLQDATRKTIANRLSKLHNPK